MFVIKETIRKFENMNFHEMKFKRTHLKIINNVPDIFKVLQIHF